MARMLDSTWLSSGRSAASASPLAGVAPGQFAGREAAAGIVGICAAGTAFMGPGFWAETLAAQTASA